MKLKETQFGFAWDNAEVSRLSHDSRGNRWIQISTPKEDVQIRITPSGKVRIEERTKK